MSKKVCSEIDFLRQSAKAVQGSPLDGEPFRAIVNLLRYIQHMLDGEALAGCLIKSVALAVIYYDAIPRCSKELVAKYAPLSGHFGIVPYSPIRSRIIVCAINKPADGGAKDVLPGVWRLCVTSSSGCGAMLLSLALTTAVIYIPGLNTAFGFTSISATEYFSALALAVAIIPLVEIQKAVAYAINRRKMLKAQGRK